jgi:hypothetical protein
MEADEILDRARAQIGRPRHFPRYNYSQSNSLGSRTLRAKLLIDADTDTGTFGK